MPVFCTGSVGHFSVCVSHSRGAKYSGRCHLIEQSLLSFLKGAIGRTQIDTGATGPSGAPCYPPARLDRANLETTVRELFAAGLAESTRKTYRSGERRYLNFCATWGESPYPATERHLASFIAHLYNEGLKPLTMKISAELRPELCRYLVSSGPLRADCPGPR